MPTVWANGNCSFMNVCFPIDMLNHQVTICLNVLLPENGMNQRFTEEQIVNQSLTCLDLVKESHADQYFKSLVSAPNGKPIRSTDNLVSVLLTVSLTCPRFIPFSGNSLDL